MSLSFRLLKMSRFNEQQWICAGFLFYLCILSQVAENLQVLVQPAKAKVGEDVLLPCHITGYGASELDPQKVGVKWQFLALNGAEKELYSFDGQEHSAQRKGSRVTEEELKRGNASLLIPQIKIAEEGDYRCVVFVTPNRAEGVSHLTVSANPQVVLSSSVVTVEAGSEKSVQCSVSQFYPSSIQVRWTEISGSKEDEVTEGICTGSLADNSDGTFNVTSRLRLQPTLEDNEKKYACSVEHRTLPSNFSLTTTLLVTEHKSQNVIIFSVIGSLLVCSLIIGVALFIFVNYFRKVPPKITNITTNQKLVHLEKAIFSCQITGFKPKDIKVACYLETKVNGHKNIFSWTSIEINSNVLLQNMEQVSLFPGEEDGSELETSFQVESPKIQSHDDKTFSITCNIAAILDMHRHDGAKLSIMVHHTALSSPAVESLILSVAGVPPRLSNILAPHHIVHQELCMLTCPISCFKPKPLSISWYKKQHDGEEEKTVAAMSMSEELTRDAVEEPSGYAPSISDSVQIEDKSYCVTAMLLFIPTALEHQDTFFICEVFHEATKTKARMTTQLQVSAMPILDPIDSFPNIPKADENVTLSCRIHSFCPQKIEIFWCKDDILMTEKPENTEIVTDQTGLCHCISKITFMPSRTDRGKTISCQIRHASSLDPKRVEWNMETLTVPPIISEITSDPPVSEREKPVTLTCQVEEYYPKDCIIQWYAPNSVIKEEDPTQNPKTGLYSTKTTMTFTPTMDDHGREIVMKVLHYATMVQPVQKTFQLFLKGVPVVLDIACNPEVAGYGKPVTFTSSVSGFHPETIAVGWYKNNMKMIDGVRTTDTEKDHGGFFSLSSSLTLVPTALDFNKSICFHVNHASLQQPILKKARIHLMAMAPTVSAIERIPLLVEANKLLTLKVQMTDFAPGDLQVRWFKSKQPLDMEAATAEPKVGENGLCFAESVIKFTPKRKDQNALVTCRITHLATNHVTEKSCTLTLQGVSPVVPEQNSETVENLQSLQADSELAEMLPMNGTTGAVQIQCITTNPKAGEEVTLKCCFPHYDPDETELKWYKGIYPIHNARVEKKICQDGFVSYVTFQTDREDSECSIRCEITNEGGGQETEVCHVLKLKSTFA